MRVRNNTDWPVHPLESQAPFLAIKMQLDDLELVVNAHQHHNDDALALAPHISTQHDNTTTRIKINQQAAEALEGQSGIIGYILSRAKTANYSHRPLTKNPSRVALEHTIMDGFHGMMATAHLNHALGPQYANDFAKIRKRRLFAALTASDQARSPQEQSRYAAIAAIEAADGLLAPNSMTNLLSTFIYHGYEAAGNNPQHARALLSYTADLFTQFDIEKSLQSKDLCVKPDSAQPPRGARTLKNAAADIHDVYCRLTRNAWVREHPSDEAAQLAERGLSYN